MVRESAPAGDRLTVAAVQAAPVFLDREATTDKTIDLVEDAARRGAQVVAFPETWIPGYPAWIFGAAGWDDAAAKRAYARLLENAVAIPGPEIDRLCACAQRNGVTLVVGVNERDDRFSRGTIYNSQVFIGSAGEILGVHRKLMPTHAERILWAGGDGSTLGVFETGACRIGGLICWEHWMPLARFAMHALGEELHVASWPEASYVTELASRSYAFEGRCFVIAAGPILRQLDIPEDFELAAAMRAGFDPGEDLLVRGGSGVVGPDGQWIAGPVYDEETIVIAEVDLRRRAEELQAFDAAGHYHRADIFQLRVDASERLPMLFDRPQVGASLADRSDHETMPLREGERHE